MTNYKFLQLSRKLLPIQIHDRHDLRDRLHDRRVHHDRHHVHLHDRRVHHDRHTVLMHDRYYHHFSLNFNSSISSDSINAICFEFVAIDSRGDSKNDSKSSPIQKTISASCNISA